MRKRVLKKLSSIVLIIVMLLSTVEPAIVAFANETSVTIDKGDYVFQYDITSQWDNHINASVTITNTGDKVIDNWSVKYNINGEIENIWNAVVYDKKDGEYIIKNASWNQDINVGQSVSFGYTLYTENNELPSDAQIICGESVVNNSEYEVNYNISNSWGTGCVADININNVGSDVIEDWILEFDYENEITSISGGVIVEHTDNHYIVKNPSYSQNIGVNGNAYIQILANLGNEEARLTNIVLRQVKTETIYEEQEEIIDDYISNEELLKEDYEKLQIEVGIGDSYDDINGNVIFTDKGYNGSDIIWETSDEIIINKSGVVNRDIEEETTVTCTAVLTLDGQTITKEFVLTVKPKSNIYSKNMGDCNLEDLKLVNRKDENYYIDINQYGYVEQVYGRYSGVIVNSAETALYSLYNVRTALGISDPFEELELYDVDKDETGQIYKFRQMVNGVPCYDNNIVISCDAEGNTDYLMSDYFPVKNEINITPSISYDDVDEYILSEYPNAIIEDVVDENMFVFNYYGKCALVWQKYVYTPETTYVMLVNAENGNIVYKSECEYNAKDVSASGEDLLENERTITVKQTTSFFGNKKYYLEDRERNIKVYDAGGSQTWSFWDEPSVIKNKNNEWTAEQISAMANMEEVYDFYLETFDRVSYDDAWWKWSGNDVEVYINTGIEDNARWIPNKKAIFIGYGVENSVTYREMSLAADRDTICHEFTHAVVENETSLNKIYYGTTGAINEGYADLFACFFDKDWMVSEDITVRECLRNIENPTLSCNPKAIDDMHYLDYKTEKDDDGGVHKNSTLVSHTAYRMYDAGIDMDTLQKLWYKSLCLGYSKHSDFYDVRLKVTKAAKKLKLSDEYVEIINNAFDDANILETNCDETYESYYKEIDKMSVAEEFMTNNTYIMGKVVEADSDMNIKNNISIENVSIDIKDSNGNIVNDNTDIDGLYNIKNENDNFFVMTLQSDGYISEEYYVESINSLHNQIQCCTIEMIPIENSGVGQASGKIVSASTYKGVKGLKLIARKGINNIYSEIVAVTETGNDGEYLFSSLEAGNYTVEIVDNLDRYMGTYINVKVIGNSIIEEQNGSVVLPLQEGGMRIVLTWGKNTPDLDAHLVSNASENPFHVYYELKKDYYNGRIACDITTDERSYHRPEMISLYYAAVGFYDYYVYNYRNSSEVASTNAMVQIYIGGEERVSHTLYVPSGEGRYWDVFTYNSATKTIIPINEMR